MSASPLTPQLTLSQESKTVITGSILFTCCVHGFAAASVRTSSSPVSESIVSAVVALACGFLLLRWFQRQSCLASALLLKATSLTISSLIIVHNGENNGWRILTSCLSSAASAVIDVTILSLILELWQDESGDRLLALSAFFSAGFAVSFFCPPIGILTPDRMASILMVAAAIVVLFMHWRHGYRDEKRRLRDWKAMMTEDEAVKRFDSIRIIRPLSHNLSLISIVCLILVCVRVSWFASLILLKDFYVKIGFSPHLPLSEVSIRLVMTASVVVFILVGRIIGHLSLRIMTTVSLTLLLIGSFVQVTTTNPVHMWSAIAFLGFGFAAASPLLLSLLESMMNVTNRVTGVLMSVAGLTELIRMADVGKEGGRESLLFSGISIFSSGVAVLLLFALHFLAARFNHEVMTGRR